MSTIKMNNVSYTGRNVTIINGKVIIDGKDMTPDAKQINIEVIGNIDTLDVDYCEKLAVVGDVTNAKTSSGNLEIKGTVKGAVTSSSGSIDITGDVNGDVRSSSGSVHCGNIKGSVSTSSGSIKNKS